MKVLPFEEKPFFQCYHNRAFPLGVIQGNAATDIMPWLCAKYINCSFEPQSYGMKFDICTFDAWGNIEKITTSQTISLDKPIYDLLNINIIETIKKLIDNNYYVHGGYNEKYIPRKAAYKKYDCPHDYMIIGYDDENKKLISVGYTDSEKYERFEINYEDYIQSLSKEHIEINTCKFNKNFKILLNLDRVISELKDYISSSNSAYNAFLKKHYGIDALEKFKDYISECYENKKIVEKKYTRAFNEHRNMMLNRIRYLAQEIRAIRMDFVNVYSETFSYATNLYLLSIKNQIKPSKRITTAMINLITHIIEADKKNIPEIIEELEDYRKREKMEEKKQDRKKSSLY